MSNPIRRPYQPIPKDLSKTSTWYCQGCGTLQPVESCGNGIENGLTISGFGGYYGGFSDSMFDVGTTEQWDEVNSAHLCHDCMVKLFTVLPVLAQSLNLTTGCHPSNNPETPCCQWSWTSNDRQMYYAKLNVFGNLVWEPRET